ncbi:MAG: SprT family zinc-dependent metalloprotease [Campylobacterota bacterium]|nr:SprT family zinc-dependent metalloprotease [Campylobacterota bacterium]
MQIILDGHSFILVHRTNKKIKRVSLTIENKDEIILKTPLKFKQHLLKQIVYEHKDWILNHIKRATPKNSFDFVSGETIPFLGKDYPMRLIKDDEVKNIKFEFINNEFLIYYNNLEQTYEEYIDALKLFYKINAKKIINPIFDKWIEKTELIPNKISYRFNKTRWGSCSYENNISINYKLLQFKEEVIEYVVLHELAHIKEKNHSKRFWSIVSFYIPNYKVLENQLKSKLF